MLTAKERKEAHIELTGRKRQIATLNCLKRKLEKKHQIGWKSIVIYAIRAHKHMSAILHLSLENQSGKQ